MQALASAEIKDLEQLLENKVHELRAKYWEFGCLSNDKKLLSACYCASELLANFRRIVFMVKCHPKTGFPCEITPKLKGI